LFKNAVKDSGVDDEYNDCQSTDHEPACPARVAGREKPDETD
jgi:hypothetical protein